jgi:hypothetical protein
MSTDCYIGVSPKVPRKKFINIASKEEKEKFKKKMEQVIPNMSEEEFYIRL